MWWRTTNSRSKEPSERWVVECLRWCLRWSPRWSHSSSANKENHYFTLDFKTSAKALDGQSILIFGVERLRFHLSCQNLLLVCRASHLDNWYRASVWLALAANDLLSSCDLHFQILPLFLIGDVVNSTMQCLVNQGYWIRHFVVVRWLSLYFGEIC